MASFWKVPTELDVEQVQEYLFLLQNALKHLLKPTLSTVFMDLDSYLNWRVALWVPTFTFDKTRQKNSLQYSVKKKFGDYFNIVNS
jgi:hypothetical protein